MTRVPSFCRLSNFIPISIFLVALVSFIAASAFAEIATPDQMRQVCRNWLNYSALQINHWAGNTTPVISAERQIRDGNLLLGTYFEIEPSGYVVVPALMVLPPIQVYSEDSRLDENQSEGMEKLIREFLANRSEIFIRAYGSLESVPADKGNSLFGSEHRLLWDKMAVPDEEFISSLGKDGADTRETVGPLLTTAWHQGYPYNSLCPVGDGGRCVVGCVATAAAQIMYYYQWPPHGAGSNLYFWNGDQSCDGTSSGMNLSADFSDEYIFNTVTANLAELNYEIGVAFEMDYGVCGSGIYISQMPGVIAAWIDNFRYREEVNQVDRSAKTPMQWFGIIQQEINAGRPTHYFITSHSIVCDGWRINGGMNQYHMNYGWGGSQNSWFTVDNLYCPADECYMSHEFMLRNIEPDMGVNIAADTTFGHIPLDVAFSGSSDLTVDSWIWAFGDGDSAAGDYQICNHQFTEPGIYDISLAVVVGTDSSRFTRTDYIVALADTLSADTIMAHPGDTIEVVYYARNLIPLGMIKVPIEYAGDIDLEYLNYSTLGCRTESFEYQDEISIDTELKRVAFQLKSSVGGLTPDLTPGYGPILKVYFRVNSGTFNQVMPLVGDGFYIHQPTFSGILATYSPMTTFAAVKIDFLCGDVNADAAVNVLDIVFLINHKFKDGPAPVPMASGDINGDGTINILDILGLIDYKFKGGAAPACQ